MEKDKDKIDELEKRIAYLEAVLPYVQLQKHYTWATPVVYPPVNANPNLHYHNGMPCYKNPCVWC